MCSDPLDPDGEVRGCSVGCTIAMSDVSPSVWIQQAGTYREFPFKKNCFVMWVCFRCGGILSCSDWHKIVILFPLHCMNFESYAAHRTPPLSAVCCKKQQQQKTPRVQQCTSSLLIPCAHGKMSSTTVCTVYTSRKSGKK